MFKRDCLSRLTTATAIAALRPTTPTAIVTRRGRAITRGINPWMVKRILANDMKLERLRRTVRDKRGWDYNCHAAWFAEAVYRKAFRNLTEDGTESDVRELVNQREKLCMDFLVVLKTLVRVEERQPGWGEDEEDSD